MTEFQKREFEEIEKLQQRLDKYGLKVNRRTTGGYYDGKDPNVFILWMTTESHPVKGNKKLIEQLRRDGFHPVTFRTSDYRTGASYMVFQVSASARINTSEL